MDTPSDTISIVVAFVFGAVVPAGTFYAITEALPVEFLGDLVLLAWVAVILAGTGLLGVVLHLPTAALLSGGGLGTVVGFWAFAALAGWSFVMFAIAAVAVLGVVLGAWGAYEWNRREGDTREPPVGTWRLVFATAATLLFAIPLLLLLL